MQGILEEISAFKFDTYRPEEVLLKITKEIVLNQFSKDSNFDVLKEKQDQIHLLTDIKEFYEGAVYILKHLNI